MSVDYLHKKWLIYISYGDANWLAVDLLWSCKLVYCAVSAVIILTQGCCVGLQVVTVAFPEFMSVSVRQVYLYLYRSQQNLTYTAGSHLASLKAYNSLFLREPQRGGDIACEICSSLYEIIFSGRTLSSVLILKGSGAFLHAALSDLNTADIALVLLLSSWVPTL